MDLLTREQILAASDLREEVVEVPEWGGRVRVRTMSGWAKDRYEVSLMGSASADGEQRISNVRARLVSYCAVDAEGNALFTEADIAALGAKSAAALDRVVAACQRVSAISEAEIAKLGEG